MTKPEKKVKKVMREFKKGKLNIGGSKKKVKNRKQAIAIALSKRASIKNGDNMKKVGNGDKVVVDHNKFINKDGFKTGGIEVEMTDPQKTQSFAVKGQKGVLPEKKKQAKLF